MNLEKGFKYRLCLQKSYLDKGMALTNYVKYLIAFFGLASADVKTTLIIGIIYIFVCYIIGRWWYISNFVTAEAEVSNQFNLFQQQIRKKFAIPNNQKI